MSITLRQSERSPLTAPGPSAPGFTATGPTTAGCAELTGQVTLDVPGPLLMRNPVRDYAWGSTLALAELQHRTPDGRPEAELWMGAHPSAPSELVLGDGSVASLATAIDQAAPAVLGSDCLRRFGPRLPFLLKVLAVERALSIQVHPSAEQAEAGFSAEQAANVPLRERTYADPYAKPEMLVAATAFTALAGLRPQGEAVRLLRGLGVDELRPVIDTVTEHGPASALIQLATVPPDARSAVAGAIRLRVSQPGFVSDDRTGFVSDDRPGFVSDDRPGFVPDDRPGFVPDERDPGADAGRAPSALGDGEGQDGEIALVRRWVLALAAQHPGDPLAVAPCLLQLHRLPAGAGLYLPAGVPHAYLSGVGVEIMGASDNVVRAGLTSKRVDAATLAAILDPAAAPIRYPALDMPDPDSGSAPGEMSWAPPVREFALTRIKVDGAATLCRGEDDRPGPEILLCLSGTVHASLEGREVAIDRGQSAFVGATSAAMSLSGQGTVFRAQVGRAPA
jgi:mannose-6-phosphate isomerase